MIAVGESVEMSTEAASAPETTEHSGHAHLFGRCPALPLASHTSRYPLLFEKTAPLTGSTNTWVVV